MQIEYRNDTKLLAVIGDPIGHSLSPLLQNTMLRKLGLNYLYLACPVAPGGLPQWLAAVKTMGIAGFNATMPHKLDLIPLLDVLTPAAKRNGAVNTVQRDGDRLIGHNTDGIGFARSLQDAGCGFSGAHVTVLGAGGAASAIVRQALDDGASSVTIRNRSLERAQLLCSDAPGKMRAIPATEPLPGDTDLLINTLPIGAVWEKDLLAPLHSDCAVFDILYVPEVTPLMSLARERRMHAVNGLGMLIYQAIYALQFFVGEPIDDTAMGRLLYETVKNR